MQNNHAWNKILFGPPGTGKTYSIDSFIKQLKRVSDENNLHDQVISSWKDAILLAFKNEQFKPMSSSEISKTTTIQYFKEHKSAKTPDRTISTELIMNATEDSTLSKRRTGLDYFESLPNNKWHLTSKGIAAANALQADNPASSTPCITELVTFHQSYGYEEFIEGVVATTNNGQITYAVKDGVFKAFCRRAEQNPETNYLFVIDEINRGNISKIFGELITLIEPTKRLGQPEAITVKLPYSGEEFGVPNNVYILGTMNTADRSITMMDTALRRRFEFVEMMPDTDVIKDHVGVIDGIDIAAILSTINQRIEFLYDREHMIGHAFFIGVQNLNDLQHIFENKVIPLLQEYFYEDYEKIQAVLNDTHELYIARNNQRSGNLFSRQFADLVNDYDALRFTLKAHITVEEFKLFVQNIVAEVPATNIDYRGLEAAE